MWYNRCIKAISINFLLICSSLFSYEITWCIIRDWIYVGHHSSLAGEHADKLYFSSPGNKKMQSSTLLTVVKGVVSSASLRDRDLPQMGVKLFRLDIRSIKLRLRRLWSWSSSSSSSSSRAVELIPSSSYSSMKAVIHKDNSNNTVKPDYKDNSWQGNCGFKQQIIT